MPLGWRCQTFESFENKSSDFIQRLALWSSPLPSLPHWPMIEAVYIENSSAGALYRAKSNNMRTRTSFSKSPRFLLKMDDTEILKYVV